MRRADELASPFSVRPLAPREIRFCRYRERSAGVIQGTPSSLKFVGSAEAGVPPPITSEISPIVVQHQQVGITQGADGVTRPTPHLSRPAAAEDLVRTPAPRGRGRLLR